jgi:hypothetical protein
MAPYNVPFPPEHAGVNVVALRQKMTELWRFEDVFKIHMFMNFDELKLNYKLILSQISENGLRNHAKPWLRKIKKEDYICYRQS